MGIKGLCLVLLLVCVGSVSSSDGRLHPPWNRRLPDSDPTAGHRLSRQTGVGADYAPEYGNKLKVPNGSIEQTSDSPEEGFTRPSASSLDVGAALLNIAFVDVIPSSVISQEDVIVSPTGVPDVTPTFAKLLASSEQKHISVSPLASGEIRPSNFDDTTHLHPTLPEDMTPSSVAPSVKIAENSASPSPGDDTLFFNVVESLRATNTSFSEDVTPHVKNTEVGAKYPDVNLDTLFREYAERDGVRLGTNGTSSASGERTGGVESVDVQPLKRTDFGHQSAANLSKNNGRTQPKIATVFLERLSDTAAGPVRASAKQEIATKENAKQELVNDETHPPGNATSYAYSGRRAADEEQAAQITATKIEDRLKSSLFQSQPLTGPLKTPQRQQTANLKPDDIPVEVPLDKGDEQSTSAAPVEETVEEETDPAQDMTSHFGQPTPMYRFNRFHHSAPVLVDGEPNAFVYVDKSSLRSHNFVSGAHATVSETDDDVSTRGDGDQLQYANAATRVHGGVIYVYEDEKSPPTQVAIPCSGCQSKLRFLPVVGNPSAGGIDIVGDPSGRDVKGSLSDLGKLQPSALFTASLRAGDMLPATYAGGFGPKVYSDVELSTSFSKDIVRENPHSSTREEQSSGRSSNATQSNKSVKISGFYETKSPAGLHFAGDHSRVTFSGHIPHSSYDSIYYLPLPGTYGFLPTPFSYNSNVAHGKSFSGYLRHPTTLSQYTRTKRSGTLREEDESSESTSVERKVYQNSSHYLPVNASPLATKQQNGYSLPFHIFTSAVDSKNIRFPKPSTAVSLIAPTSKKKRRSLDARQRRATFEKVQVLRQRRPVTSTPRPPPTSGQLTRGQRYTVLNDIHANMRQSRRMQTSTTRPAATTTTTESDQELHEQTLQMIRGLRDEQLAPQRSESAEYKTALTAQLKKQLQAQEVLNHTSTNTSQAELEMTAHFGEVVSGKNSSKDSSDKDVGESTTRPTKSEEKLQPNSLKQGDGNNDHTSIKPLEDAKHHAMKVVQPKDVLPHGSLEQQPGEQYQFSEREIKKPERNAELAIQLKEQLLRNSKAPKYAPVVTRARHFAPGIKVLSKAKLIPVETGSPAPTAVGRNRLVLATTTPQNHKLGVDDLINFGKALKTFPSISGHNIKGVKAFFTSVPATKDHEDNMAQNYVNVGAPEDYLRQVMLHDAITAGTLLHVAAIEQTLFQEPETPSDESLELDAVTERLPFDSIYTDQLEIPSDEYEVGYGFLEDDLHAPITDSELAVTGEHSPASTDAFRLDSNQNTYFIRGFNAGLALSSLSEDHLSKKTRPIPSSVLRHPQRVPSHPISISKDPGFRSNQVELVVRSPGFGHSKSPVSVHGEVGSEHGHPTFHPSFPGSLELHTRRPALSLDQLRYKDENFPGIRPGSSIRSVSGIRSGSGIRPGLGGRPRPGVRPVSADRPINTGVLLEETSDISPPGSSFGSAEFLAKPNIDSEKAERLPLDFGTEILQRPGVGSGPAVRPRPGHRPGSGHVHYGRPVNFRRPGPGHRPPPPRPPQGFFRRMYHRMMHGFHRMMSGPRRAPHHRRPAPGTEHDPHAAHRPRGMHGLLGIYHSGADQPEHEET